MTDLQIGLIIIGVVIIAVVVAYNKWQTHRVQSEVKRAFADAPDDVLMRAPDSENPGIRREPVFVRNTVAGVELQDPHVDGVVSISGIGWSRDGRPVQDEVMEVFPDEGEALPDEYRVPVEGDDTDGYDSEVKEPYIDFSDDAPVLEELPVKVPEVPSEEVFAEDVPLEEESVDRFGVEEVADGDDLTEEMLISPLRSLSRLHLPVDDLIDYSISMFFTEPVRAEKIMPLIQSVRNTGSKPVNFIGLCLDEKTGEDFWQVIAHGGIYFQLRAGVQLANRTGSLNEIEYSELITRLRQLADSINAEIEVPDMTDVLREARELYRFVVNHDARLGINVRTMGSPWMIRTLIAVLERQKLDMRPDGFFVKHDTDGSVLFSLVINASPAAEVASSVTLLLDVPCVMQEKNGFDVMVSCAKTLCLRLNGVLVDDEDKMLTDPMLVDIAGQVSVFYEEMKAASIPAGSTRALRLFG